MYLTYLHEKELQINFNLCTKNIPINSKLKIWTVEEKQK